MAGHRHVHQLGGRRHRGPGGRPLGSLAGTIGLRPTLWVAVVGALTSFLRLLPSPIRRLRTLPAPEPHTPSA